MLGADERYGASRFRAGDAIRAWLVLMALAGLFACDKHTPSKPSVAAWYSLGFEDKIAVRMVCAGDSLYVCTGLDGLWRLNLARDNPQWESLGLIDSTSGDWWFGVQDVDVKNEDILVACMSRIANSDPGVWRSTDAGRSWARSDSGIPGPEYPVSYAYSVGRSPHDPNIGLAINGSVFRTTDRGRTWELQGERRGDISNAIYMYWNPSVSGEVWIYGQNCYWEPILAKSIDWGLSAEGFDFIRDLRGGVVYDVTVDPLSGTTIYAAIGSGVCKSVDGGGEWAVPLFWDKGKRAIRSMVCSGVTKNVVYFAVGNDVYRSYDGGETVELVENEIDRTIMSMVFHKSSRSLLVGTTSGVHQFTNVD